MRIDFGGFLSEEGASGCTICLIFFPSNEAVGGSLYCVESDHPTLFLPDPDADPGVWTRVSTADVLVTGADALLLESTLKNRVKSPSTPGFDPFPFPRFSSLRLDSRGGVGGLTCAVGGGCGGFEAAADSTMAAASSVAVPLCCNPHRDSPY